MALLRSQVLVEDISSDAQVESRSVTECLAVGITERGPIGEAPLCTSFEAWRKIYGGYTVESRPMCAAAKAYFDNGGARLRTSRVTKMGEPIGDPSTTAAVKGTLDILTPSSAPFAGSTQSAVEPFNLEPNQTIDVAFETGGTQSFTVLASAASVETTNAGPYALSNGQTLVVNGVTRTILTAEFANIAAAEPAELVAIYNTLFLANSMPLIATVTSAGTKVTITSIQRGTGASFTNGGGTADAIIGYVAGTTTGSGNVADVDTVLAVEVAALCSPLTDGTVSGASGRVTFTSATTGNLSTAQVLSSSTADTPLGFDNAVHSGGTGAAIPTWQFDGKTHGAYANELTFRFRAPTTLDPLAATLEILRNGAVVETWLDLSADPASERYFVNVLNDEALGSDLISATDLIGSPDPYVVGQRPNYATQGPMTGGDDGLAGIGDADFIGAKEGDELATGLYVFDLGDTPGTLLIMPGRATPVCDQARITYCAVNRRRLTFNIFDPPDGYTPSQVVEYVQTTALLYDSTTLGAIYYPNLLVANPSTSVFGAASTISCPASGVVAGLAARAEGAKPGGAFTHPAGPRDEMRLRNVLGFDTPNGASPSAADCDLLFPVNINPIKRENQGPIFVDGARTLQRGGTFGTVGESLGVIFVKRSLEVGLAPFRHENITEELLKREAVVTRSFLIDLTQQGCFATRDPKTAFFVDFGPALNLPSVARNEETRGRVGLATAKPNSFIIVQLGPDTRAQDAALAAG